MQFLNWYWRFMAFFDGSQFLYITGTRLTANAHANPEGVPGPAQQEEHNAMNRLLSPPPPQSGRPHQRLAGGRPYRHPACLPQACRRHHPLPGTPSS